MAQQPGNIKITGTIDNLTFYKMDGIYYVRKKSSLDGKKVRTSPKFKRTMMHANQFSIASKIASRLYRPIKKEDKNIHLFRKMLGRAKTLLHKGKEIEQINIILTEEFIKPIELRNETDIMQKGTPKAKENVKPKANQTGKRNAIRTTELSDVYVDKNGNLVINNNALSTIHHLHFTFNNSISIMYCPSAN